MHRDALVADGAITAFLAIYELVLVRIVHDFNCDVCARYVSPERVKVKKGEDLTVFEAHIDHLVANQLSSLVRLRLYLYRASQELQILFILMTTACELLSHLLLEVIDVTIVLVVFL